MPANRPYLIGLTGGIACGKSMAAAHLEALGATQLDADAISHALTAPGGEALPEIRTAFGDGVFNGDGTLNRRALGNLVFADPAARRVLEGILHPRVQRIMMSQVDQATADGVPVVVLNVPLLFETGMDALCDETWTLQVEPETQLRRLMERDGLTEEQARERVASQMSMEERAKRATVVIQNDQPLERLHAELSALYNNVLKRKVGAE